MVGPIIDPFNGQRDLVAKVFRHVSDAFAEDPLRLLRIARFAARFPQFTVAPETLEALKAIVQSGELNALSPERIWQELARGLIADKPMRMFQVLLDTAAAQTILPASLVAQLVQEPAREIMGAHLHASAAVLEQRCAVALMNLPATEIRSWAECIRMPIEVRDFSEIFSELIQFLKMNLGGTFQAIDVLAWFNRADVWRKPERGNNLLQLARKLGFKVDSLILAMKQAQLLNAPEIIATIPLEDKLNGERIRSAVEAARLATITSALNLNN